MKALVIIKRIFLSLFALSICYLAILSACTSSIITDVERTIIVQDSAELNLLLAIIVFGMLLLYFKIRLIRSRVHKIDHKCIKQYIPLLVAVLVSVWFVLNINRDPVADQKFTMNAARQWAAGDYSSLEKGAYIEKYPHQAGLVLLWIVLFQLFGNNSILAFRLFNILSLIAIHISFFEIAENDYESKSVSMWLGIFFLPGLFYVTFAYGNLIGLAFSLRAYIYSQRAMEKGKWWHYGLCLLYTLESIFIKQNYIIFGIAQIIILIGCWLSKKKTDALFLSLALIIVLMSCTSVLRGIVKWTTGHDLNSGMSRWAWIAMGMMDNDDLYDGWWNNYNSRTYLNSGNNPDAQAETAKKDIKERLAEFKSDPMGAIAFFSGKQASQWSNADFQGIWVNRYMTIQDKEKENDLISFLFSEKGVSLLYEIENRFQFIVFFGCFLFLCCYKQGSIRAQYMYLMLTFLGGFAFHILWEAKAQYTISYFWVLIPVAACGITWTARLLLSREAEKKTKEKLMCYISVFVMLILLINYINIPIITDIFVPID